MKVTVSIGCLQKSFCFWDLYGISHIHPPLGCLEVAVEFEGIEELQAKRRSTMQLEGDRRNKEKVGGGDGRGWVGSSVVNHYPPSVSGIGPQPALVSNDRRTKVNVVVDQRT